MAKSDLISSIFLVGLASAICVESVRLGTGILSNPGPGLFPFGCGLLLGILSLIALALIFKNQVKEVENLRKEKVKTNVILTLASIISYPFLMQLLGFRLVTVLWMFFVCWIIGRIRWKTSIFISLVTTFMTYYLFAKLLEIRFSSGIFGF